MRVLDLLRGRKDIKEICKKPRRKKSSNRGSPPPHSEPQTPHSLFSRRIFNLTPATSDGSCSSSDGTTLGCLVPFSNYCCKNEMEGEDKKEEGFVLDEETATIPATLDSMKEDKERKHEALSFNLGMGAGLVFLLAKTASEFNKMAELRSEMEMMLKYIKGEIQRKPAASILPESKVHSFPNSNYWGSECSNKPQHFHEDTESCNFMGAYGAMPSYMKSNCHMDLDAKMCSKGNEMEQELQVELRRLQINLEGQVSSIHPHQDRLEVESESSEIFNDTYQQANEPKAEANKQSGVCPLELERRLHELLEARQHERIAELQAALECSERKLNEKEMEICWWRDTARLVSKHREERLQLQF